VQENVGARELNAGSGEISVGFSGMFAGYGVKYLGVLEIPRGSLDG
jgi:hypothetical protein